MTNNTKITVFPSSNDLFQFAANDFASRSIAAIKNKGTFSVVLAGGNTPKLLFDRLTEIESYNNIPWHKIKFFFGDERYVPSDKVNSNYYMAQKYLFSKVPVDPDNIYRISTEYEDPKDAANHYNNKLKEVFDIKGNGFPPFDLIYLGLGDNAHTASLMPFSNPVKCYMKNPLSDKNNQLVTSLFVSELNMYRITLTPMAINHGLNIIFLVTGENKATAVWDVLEGKMDPLHYPAQLIHSITGETIWYLDKTAAEKLRTNTTQHGK